MPKQVYKENPEVLYPLGNKRLVAEAENGGMVHIHIPVHDLVIHWRDASRFLKIVATAIRKAKIEEAKRRGLYDPEKDVATRG